MTHHLKNSRRQSRRKRLALIAAGVTAAAMLLTACGSAGASTVAAGSSDSSPPATAIVGDTLRLSLSRQLTNVHPHKGGSPDSQAAVIGSIYEALTKISAKNEVQPNLATSWTQVSDTVWDFTIRTDAVFSDGTPLTVDTIVWNFEQNLNPDYEGTVGASLRTFIQSAAAIDPTTLRITLKRPAIDLPGRLWNLSIVDPTFAQSHNLNTEALGSGPYKIDALDLENGATLSLNPNFAGDEPAFAEVEYRVLASEAQRVAALQAGEVDLALNVEPLSLDLFTSDDRYTTVLGVGPQPLVLAINEEKPGPLQDVRVRQALNYAIDKQGIIDGLFSGSVKPLPGQVTFEPYQRENPAVQAYPYDPDKAKALLTEAGYANGLTVEVDLPSGTYVSADLATQVIAEQYKAVGIDLKITQTPFPAWLERQYGDAQKGADLVYIMWGSQYLGGFQLFDPFATGHIQSDVIAPEFDQLVLDVQAATDPKVQQDLVNQATQLYYDEAHTVFLYPSPFTAVISKGLTWEPKPSRYLYAQEIGRA